MFCFVIAYILVVIFRCSYINDECFFIYQSNQSSMRKVSSYYCEGYHVSKRNDLWIANVRFCSHQIHFGASLFYGSGW
jgi:hypothetical protein